MSDQAVELPAGDLPVQEASRVSGGTLWITLIAAFLGWMFDGLEMGIFPLVARPALIDLLTPEIEALKADPATLDKDKVVDKVVAPWFGKITALFLLGAASGGLLFGWLGDRIGRVRAMSYSILTYSLFSGFCYFASEAWHLGLFRFISALGMGGEWSLGVALVMECWPGKHRPWLAGAIGAASNVGFLLIALMAKVKPPTVDSWRWVMLAGAAPALLTFFIRLFVPESHRWKESARKDDRPLREIFSPPLLKTTLLAIAFASIALIGTWASVQTVPTWVDQMTGGKIPGAKANVQIVSSLGAIVGCIAGPLFGGRFGRRPAYFLLCTLSLGTCAYLFREMNEYGPKFLAMCAVVGGVTAAFYGWLPLYLPELFPTRSRATGQGLCFNFGRILAAVGVMQMANLVSNYYDGSYARACAALTLIYAVGMVLIWFAPETRGKPLPE